MAHVAPMCRVSIVASKACCGQSQISFCLYVLNEKFGPLVNGARNERDIFYDANGCVVRIDVQNRDENGLLGANTHFTTTWSFDFRNAPTQRVDEIDGALRQRSRGRDRGGLALR